MYQCHELNIHAFSYLAGINKVVGYDFGIMSNIRWQNYVVANGTYTVCSIGFTSADNVYSTWPPKVNNCQWHCTTQRSVLSGSVIQLRVNGLIDDCSSIFHDIPGGLQINKLEGNITCNVKTFRLFSYHK
jgi:hypothetical protein